MYIEIMKENFSFGFMGYLFDDFGLIFWDKQLSP